MVTMSTNVPRSKPNSHTFKTVHCQAVPPPIQLFDQDALPSEQAVVTRLFNDDSWQNSAADQGGPAEGLQLQRRHQAELLEIAGITGEMVMARIADIRAGESSNLQVTPDEYMKQGSEPEEPSAEPRPILVRLVPPTPEGTDDMQITDDTDQRPGQAAAAPATVRFAVVGMGTGPNGKATVLDASPPPEEILKRFSSGKWRLSKPWMVNFTASVLFAIKDNLIEFSSQCWSFPDQIDPARRRQLFERCFEVALEIAEDFWRYKNSIEEPITGLKARGDGRLYTTHSKPACQRIGLTEGIDPPVVAPEDSERVFANTVLCAHFQQGGTVFETMFGTGVSVIELLRGLPPRTDELPSQKEARECLALLMKAWQDFVQAQGGQASGGSLTPDDFLSGKYSAPEGPKSTDPDQGPLACLTRVVGRNQLALDPENVKKRRSEFDNTVIKHYGVDVRSLGYTPSVDNDQEIHIHPASHSLVVLPQSKN